MYKQLKFRATGIAPLLMHNGALSDPLNPITKDMKTISSKRTKTDADHEELARLSWYGALYTDENNNIVLPGYVVEATIKFAARTKRKGKDIERGVFCDQHFILDYDGPKDIDEMWRSNNFYDSQQVKVQQARIQRVRPIFRNWSVDITLNYNDELINEAEIKEYATIAGSQIGFCDYRPKFGRFEVEFLE